MDQAIRNKLRSVVTQCRRLLEESIAQQLQGKFDIYATGKKDEVRAEEVVPLGHLTEEEQQDRKDILAHFKHVEALGYKPRESLEQMIREIAFTHLNRFCAYKMMEVRDVYVGGQRFREAVSKGLKSQGFLFYRAENPEEERLFKAGEQEEVYRHFLNWLGGTLSQEIGVLFSPTDPANRVYPPQRVLDEVLDLLNSEELKAIWTEDETIGWVYQYFTPKELRDQARKASQTPRNSYELAFRNQFFTPRYVVEFLTDNTLGRIWYEMRQGDTRLRDECCYLVRRPTEVFLRDPDRPLATPPRADWVKAAARGDFSELPDEPEIDDLSDFALIHDGYELARHLGYDDPHELSKPWLDSEGSEPDLPTSTAELWTILFGFQRRWGHAGGPLGDDFLDRWKAVYRAFRDRIGATDLSQEELLRQAVYVPYRPKKDPREIKILDPACGSGHFLLYCFSLLLTIYEEAYSDPDLGKLQADFRTREELRKAIPGLILRHNLHGIDIDLRAAQIAGLALWLRCQRAFGEMGLKKDRPSITRSNVACAEPLPGEPGILANYLDNLDGSIVSRVLYSEYSIDLLDSPDEVADMLPDFKDWVDCVWKDMERAGEAGSLIQMLRVLEHVKQRIRAFRAYFNVRPILRRKLAPLFELPEDEFDRVGLKIVVAILRKFIEERIPKDGMPELLFREDTARGLIFLEINEYDYWVVLMNPPFGSPTRVGKAYLERVYPRTKNDLYAAFVERGLNFLYPGGMLGAITSRSGFFLSSFQKWREEILLGEASPTVFVDLGSGVLDTAMVETAAYCLTKSYERIN